MTQPTRRQWMARSLTLVSLLAVFGCNSTVQASTQSTSAPTKKDIVYNGQTSHVYGIARDGTMYMPVWYVMNALKNAGYQSTWTGSSATWNFTPPTNTSIDWTNVQVGSGHALIEVNQVPVKRVVPMFAKDPNSGKITTYMPIWYVMNVLKRAGVGSDWDGNTWTLHLEPSVSDTVTKPWNLAFITNTSKSLTDVETKLTGSNVLVSCNDDVLQGGTIAGDSFLPVISYAHQQGLTSLVRINCQNKTILSDVMQNKQQSLIQQIVNIVNTTDQDGVNIDFEFMPAAQRTNFIQFLTALKAQLTSSKKLLTVDVPAIVNPAKEPWNDGYDIQQIGQIADKVVVMSYDYSYPTGTPGAIAPLNWVKQTIQYAVSQIPSNKVILGLDAYAYDWTVGASAPATSESVSEALQVASAHHVSPEWDGVDQAPYYTYQANGLSHTVYYENTASLAPKIALVAQYHLGGISMWHADLEDSSIATLMNNSDN